MNSSTSRARAWVIGIVLLAGMALVTAVILTNRGQGGPELDELRRECAVLRAKIDACTGTTAELQAAIQQLRITRSDLPGNRTSPVLHSDISDLALVRAIAELSLVQSNTALVFERLLRSTLGAQSPEPPEQALRRLQALEASAVDEQQRCDAMKQKVTGLLLSLKVPEEVAGTPTSKALEMPSMQTYWPYFEAKKELEPLQRIIESLKIRVVQERVNAAVEAARSQSQ